MIIPIFTPHIKVESCEDAIGALLSIAIIAGGLFTYTHWDDVTGYYEEVTMADQERFQRSADERLAQLAEEELRDRQLKVISTYIDSAVAEQERVKGELTELIRDNREFMERLKEDKL